MEQKDRWWLRALAFLLVLGIVVCGLQGVFGVNTSRSYDSARNFLREKRGSLDAVYIGGSDVHAFWQPLFGWNEQGIAVWNCSYDSIPMSAVKYLVIEARKTQPQALLIISLSTFKKNTTETSLEDIHRIVDYQPDSLNQVHMIDRLVEKTDLAGLDKLEFYFPIIRFHSRWDSLTKWVFDASDRDYKASMHSNAFRNLIADQRSAYNRTEERAALPEDVEETMTDLLEYLDSEGLQVLFVKVPQAVSEEKCARMNTLEDMVTAHGYPCLDVLDEYEDLDLDLEHDFYNNYHTNIHGSLKYSRYLGKYLVEHYGFEDKRGRPEWKSWDDAAVEYLEYLSPYVLPLETVPTRRDASLATPELKQLKADGRSLTLSWEPSEGADGYEIYRNEPDGDKHWMLVASIDGETLSYTDEGLPAKTVFNYTVVPFRETEEGMVYGNFDVVGINAKTGR